MSEFFGRPTATGGSITMGENLCHIVDIKDLSKEKTNMDIALEFTLGFPGTEWLRAFRAYFKFTRDQKGKIQPGDKCPGVKRFYERFLDYLGLNQIGLNANGQIVHTDGTKVVNIVEYFKTALRMNEDSYMCYIVPNDFEGKTYQQVEFLVDTKDQLATKKAKGYIGWKESNVPKPNGQILQNEEELPDL